MARTDRHQRYLMRLITSRTLLYTEMVPAQALLRGNRDRFLSLDSVEHPIALQLGGSDPAALADCVQLAESAGFDEINLNLGCPSPRVQQGQFGASLMARPALVALCIAAMTAVTNLPITIKTRIGIDQLDEYWRLLRL